MARSWVGLAWRVKLRHYQEPEEPVPSDPSDGSGDRGSHLDAYGYCESPRLKLTPRGESFGLALVLVIFGVVAVVTEPSEWTGYGYPGVALLAVIFGIVRGRRSN